MKINDKIHAKEIFSHILSKYAHNLFISALYNIETDQ